MSLGTLLRKNRDRCKLTGSEIADLLGVSQGTYHNWESGKTNLPAKYLPQLAEIFKVEIIELIPARNVALSHDRPQSANQEKVATDSEAKVEPLELYQKLLESKEVVIRLQTEEIRRLQKRLADLEANSF
ncbi:helix-turn-helix transcriptional regulator [Runella sp. MFBS21]|uniref:helix-turn-helix domain-containing protein n=1 Tax=Runella sp. MFBS21 TaxID=3034018 RepID=UPI0023F69D3A|nr:helix-turn-helix transcriptional regulator [Runella sp. MFBS21]MDF7816512.1 helix-turn-helix transcriptional regulator [Runella sp. MFBS21]